MLRLTNDTTCCMLGMPWVPLHDATGNEVSLIEDDAGGEFIDPEKVPSRGWSPTVWFAILLSVVLNLLLVVTIGALLLYGLSTAGEATDAADYSLAEMPQMCPAGHECADMSMLRGSSD